jgi:hypothetical protein
MYFLVLDAHGYDPSIRVPVYLRVALLDDFEHSFFDYLSISSHFPHWRPVVVSLVEIIPVHLVNSHCEDGLELRVHSLWNEALVEQLVYVDSGGVTVIKNKWVSQWFWLGIEWYLVLDECKQLFVHHITVQESLPDFLASASILKCLGAEYSWVSIKLLNFFTTHAYYINPIYNVSEQ